MRLLPIIVSVSLCVCLWRTPVSRADAPATLPTTAPDTLPKNIDKALEEEIADFKADGRLEDIINFLRVSTRTNIAINWPALNLSGITRDTPVNLRLHQLSYEQILRSLMEVLPAEKSRPNFTVGENTIEITTTAELAKRAVPRIYDIALATSASLDTTKPTPEQRAKHADFLKQVIHKQLLNAGEDPDAPDRYIATKDDHLAANQSQRAQLYIRWTINLFEAPTKLHSTAQGTALTVQAKKTEARIKELSGNENHRIPFLSLVRDPAKYAPDLNIILLPNAAAELAKPEPQIDYFITDAGVIEIAPAADLVNHVTLGVYDLRDILKRLAFKSKQKPAPDNADLAAAVLAILKEKVPPYRDAAMGTWGDLEKSPSSLTLYEGYLVVFANAKTHRTLAAALEDIYKQ